LRKIIDTISFCVSQNKKEEARFGEEEGGLGHRRGARAGFGFGPPLFYLSSFSVSFLFGPAPLEGDSRERVRISAICLQEDLFLSCPPDPSLYIKQNSCQKITGEFDLRKNKNLT
jgi:hypothetical protein